MRFLPKQAYTTFTQIHSGEPILESYIDTTKNSINDQLPAIFHPAKQNLPKSQRSALKVFKQARSKITVKPADKNLGLVVLDTNDYLHLCATHLANPNTYQQTKSFPPAAIQKELQNTLSEHSKSLRIHKKLYNFLSPDQKRSQIPRFYGIPKVHKSYEFLPPIRPIVSHSNSQLSPSAHFIDHVLQPIARSYEDYLHNSTALLRTLQDFPIPDNAILVTIDIESLYPSIPQDECLTIIYQEMFTKNELYYSIRTLL